ncbi:MAG: sugar phosphate isomerase/epimerase [Ruminococcaceae bacterium]|nr:sugar phosphate isomerase/epimerase [Oscillospiraceae bacterium]
MKIGAQLYTVHGFCQTLDDLAETFKKIADIGYTTVQVSGTCPYEADWLAEQLKKNGLTCGITHYNLDRILHDTAKVVEEHKTFSCSYIGVGGIPGGFGKVSDFAKDAKAAAGLIHDSGCHFMYHNHSWEYENKFADGRNVMEFLSDTFTAEEMGFTLDTYWVKYGGADPLDEIKRLRGRLPVVHYKDMKILDDGTRQMQWIGGGNTMDFEKLTEAFAAAGTQYAYVEQDDCNGEDPFLCLKRSYDYLCSIGLN